MPKIDSRVEVEFDDGKHLFMKFTDIMKSLTPGVEASGYRVYVNGALVCETDDYKPPWSG